jgi:hypothetical protein
MKGYGPGAVDIDLGALMPRWEQVRGYEHLGLAFGEHLGHNIVSIQE